MMNILARILSHGFAIAVVVLLALGYLYRGELFPEYDVLGWLGIDSDETAESPAAPTAGVGEGQPAEEAPSTTGTAGEPEAGADVSGPGDVAETGAVADTAGDQAEAAAAESVAAEPVVAEPVAEEPVTEEPVEAEPVAAEPVVAEPVTEEPAAEAPAAAKPVEAEPAAAEPVAAEPVTEEPVTEVPAAAEPVAEEPVTAEPVTAEPVAAEPAPVQAEAGSVDSPATAAPAPAAAEMPGHRDAYQKLADAREAFWLRDYETAEAHYRELIGLEPGNPDGYGELGNMFFSQGDWEKAASAYFEAGIRLVEQGMIQQAAQLVQVIRGLDGAQADELDAAIKAAGKE